jgi:hypothetical protein
MQITLRVLRLALRSMKEHDWTREKNGIASAGTATKNGVVKAGSAISGGVKSLFSKKQPQ